MNDDATRDLLIDQALSAWRDRDAGDGARTAALQAVRAELAPASESRLMGRDPTQSTKPARRGTKRSQVSARPPQTMHSVDTYRAAFDDSDERATVSEFTYARRTRQFTAIGVALTILFCWFGLPALRNATPTQPVARVATSSTEVRKISNNSGPPAKRIEDIQLGDRVAGPMQEPNGDAPAAASALLPPLSAEELALLEELELLVPDEPVWHQVSPSAVIPHGFSFLVENDVIKHVQDLTPKVRAELVGQRYVVGDVDATDVSPWTWRTVSMELAKPDGSLARLSVARPLWWIEEAGARPGAVLDIAMHEVGLEGQAKVLDVGLLDVDDAFDDPKACVVIATIAHHNAIVWDLRFEDERGPPLGVTANHSIYSLDRDDWVPAGDLRIGETVATYDGSTKLANKTERPGRHTVHNLEVHRSHAYHVSQFGVLAHNTGFACGLARKFDGPIHHIATDKGAFAARFRVLFDRVGVSLQSPWNRMRVPGHVGPHGEFYHRLILQRLTAAVGTNTGQAARFAFIRELRAIRYDIRYNGWDALLKAAASRVDVLGGF